MSLARQVRRHALELAAVLALVAAAVAVGAYVLEHQRLRFPWDDVYTVAAEFTSAQAVTPGQGQTVAVAGVTVGEVSKVTLRDGRALVEMEIERDRLPSVHRGATAFLRPKTGLQDMSVQLDPGSPAAPALPDGAVLPVAATRPQVASDEVLAALDADTRASLTILADAGGRGLRGRGPDLRAIFKAGRPTLEQTARITAAIADRRAKLARLVRNLRLLGESAVEKDDELARLVDSAQATLGAIAAQDAALRGAMARLPGTLDAARAALASARPFAERLGPSLDALRPTARALAPALRDVRPLLEDGLPAARRIRALARDAQPALRDLRPALRDLRAVTPDLTRTFGVLEYVVNELAYNPPGPEEGYLFWTAWFAHNAASILSVEDAHGVVWRGQVIASCSTYAAIPDFAPLLQLLIATPACPAEQDGGGG